MVWQGKDVAAVTALLEKDVNVVYARTEDDQSAMHLAAQNNDMDMAKLLLEVSDTW